MPYKAAYTLKSGKASYKLAVHPIRLQKALQVGKHPHKVATLPQIVANSLKLLQIPPKNGCIPPASPQMAASLSLWGCAKQWWGGGGGHKVPFVSLSRGPER